MEIRLNSNSLKYLLIVTLISACQGPNFSLLKEKSTAVFDSGKKSALNIFKSDKVMSDNGADLSLSEILDSSLASGSLGSDFVDVMTSALKQDPTIAEKRRNFEAKAAAVTSVEAKKDFQVSGTVYGGVEDVTDKTSGLALVLNASRVIYDGGIIDSTIATERFLADSANLELEATINERAFRLGKIWIELEKYEQLQDLIDRRLSVLDPLIYQLEQVAKAGIGDVSKVTAAQRTVATIRVAETNITEGLAQARLNFINAFGELPERVSYDSNFIAKMVPKNIDHEIIQKSPLLLSRYANYQAGISKVHSLKAKDNFSIGFEARASKPFAGSDYDSDESIGLVARKTFFNGGMLESEIKAAQAIVEASAANIKATFRDGARIIETSQQNIVSMGKAIILAKENARLTAEEIVYLRQQLVIGGSTLDSVLSAEARLYDAESNEINFLAEKYKSEITIVSALGLLNEPFAP